MCIRDRVREQVEKEEKEDVEMKEEPKEEPEEEELEEGEVPAPPWSVRSALQRPKTSQAAEPEIQETPRRRRPGYAVGEVVVRVRSRKQEKRF